MGCLSAESGKQLIEGAFMYKKCIAGASILLLLLVLFFTAGLQKIKFALLNPVSSVLSEEIWNGKVRAERFALGGLFCNGVLLAEDSVEKTFYVPVDMENETWEKMEFTVEAPGYELLFSEDFTEYDKQQVIREGWDIEFLIYNDTEFSTYHLVFTGLPVISLSTAEGLENQKEIAGNAVFYDTNFTSQGIQTSAYEGHVRGNTSTLYPKKGYKLNLKKQYADGSIRKNKLSLFGMREDDDWILYAIYNDESKLREKLSLELWDAFGSKEISAGAVYNSAMTYVEVLVDNAYYGLYGLKEPIDAKQLKLKESDYLYKREDHGDFSEETFLQAKDPLEHVLGFEIKSGVSDEDAWLPMAAFSAVQTASDEVFKETAGTCMDTDNAMRLWLYIQVVAGYDQWKKNEFYIARKQGDGYYFTFAPWDLDLTWGNRSDSNADTWYTAYDDSLIEKYYYWETGDRLVRLNVDNAEAKVQKLYKELRQNVLSDDALEQRIMEIDHVLRDSGAYERERVRWPESALAEDPQIVLNFAKERMNYLDTALYDLKQFMVLD